MESISLATITTAVVTLAIDAATNLADAKLQKMWSDVKGWLGWSKDEPAAPELPVKVAEVLNSNEALAQKILGYLQAAPPKYLWKHQVDCETFRVTCKTFVQAQTIVSLTINS